MPELIEVEMYAAAARPATGRTIRDVVAPDDWYLKGVDAASLTDVMLGATIERVDRHGKVLLLDSSAGTLGLRFGMTGRLVVDDSPVIDRLEYSSERLDPAWDRFALGLDPAMVLTVNDPRRLGGVTLDPEIGMLGPDAWGITRAELRDAVGVRRVAVKALLLDQRSLAGLGNLLVDELLWRCGIAPTRPARDLTSAEVGKLADRLPAMLGELHERGGSHRGDLFPERRVDGRCPVDGSPLVHGTVGGRSTWWCRTHQR